MAPDIYYPDIGSANPGRFSSDLRDEEKPHSAIQAFRFGFEQSHCRTGKDSCNRTVRRIYGSTSSGRGRKIHYEECPFSIADAHQ